MKKGDEVTINKDIFAVSQKTQKSLAGKKGIIKEVFPKVGPLEFCIISINGEDLPFASNEITLVEK